MVCAIPIEGMENRAKGSAFTIGRPTVDSNLITAACVTFNTIRWAREKMTREKCP
jgi:hypothetical protein